MNLDPATRQRIDDLVKKNRVLLFMKGERGYPQCGFSATVVQILSAPRRPAPSPVSPKRKSPPKPSGLPDSSCMAFRLVTKKLKGSAVWLDGLGSSSLLQPASAGSDANIASVERSLMNDFFIF